MSDGAGSSNWPTVTLIVLNYNGMEHLPACFNSLRDLDYPPDRLELMIVDNASGDGSVDYMRSHHPGVRVVQSDENLGFAGGNNLGAREAMGEHVIFLNNDMAVDSAFVTALVEALQADTEAVSAGAKILNWDGTRFDFAGAICNLAGWGAQVGFHETYDSARYADSTPTLFACGGAMIIDRGVFLDLGGFDEDYFIYFEDIDLGWRLWLLGHKVIFAPNAITYHRHHGTMERFPSYRKAVLYNRNALASVFKNYSDENLARVLPAALFLTAAGVVEEAVDTGQLDLESFSITSKKKMDRKPVSLQKANVSSLVAVQQLATDLPRWIDKRHAVQSRRKRSDEDIAHLFRPYFPPTPWRWPNTAYSVTDALGVQDLFAGAPRRVLVVSPDVLPYPGLPAVASGLRAWALGHGLKARGHDVVFSMPRHAVDGHEDQVPPEVAGLAWAPKRLGDVVRRVQPDLVLACGWPTLIQLLNRPTVPVVLDQHGPHMPERRYQTFGEEDDNASEKLRAMRMADYFTCAGERQLGYFEGWLERAGWSEQERASRAASVPVSLSPEMPVHRSAPELTFVFGGMFLPWQDPSTALEVLVAELERRQAGNLLLVGGRHPLTPIDGGVTEALAKRLEQSPRVVSPGLVPHEELMDTYARSHVAVDVAKRNPEREPAFTTPTVEYLWCGLPVIYDDCAELADHIREYEAGWTVDPEDREAIARVISGIFDHPEQVEERGRNAQRLVRERLVWDRTITPIDDFVRRPTLRRTLSLADIISGSIPAEVTLLLQRARSRLPVPVDRRLRRVAAALARTDGDTASDSPIPPEVAVLVHRAGLRVSRLDSSRVLPTALTRAARGLVRRATRA